MKESQIQAKIMKWLPLIHAYPIKIVAATRAGNPDIICCWRGLFIAIEVKQPGLNATILQKAKLQAIRESEGIAIVATSLDEVKQFFAALNAQIQSLQKNMLTSQPDSKK